ncbi:MAG: exosome complex RNA-binding protein Csl4 [Thermoplasmata archaeon]|nr:exosome complex RNA-binding protein Csl4 [Thermoplasmata archaeon]
MYKGVIIPGEEIGTTEEYIAGNGTFEKDGKIVACVLGFLKIDENERRVEVVPINPPSTIKKNSTVYCVVEDLKQAMAIVEVISVDSKIREIAGTTQGAIHISKISQKYVENITSVLRIGDILRAGVLQSAPTIQLYINEPHLGVIKAYCIRCRRPLVRKPNLRENTLYCENCDRVETRKIADDYGNVVPDWKK